MESIEKHGAYYFRFDTIGKERLSCLEVGGAQRENSLCGLESHADNSNLIKTEGLRGLKPSVDLTITQNSK